MQKIDGMIICGVSAAGILIIIGCIYIYDGMIRVNEYYDGVLKSLEDTPCSSLKSDFYYEEFYLEEKNTIFKQSAKVYDYIEKREYACLHPNGGNNE